MKIAITGSSGFVGTNFIKYASDMSITEVDLLVTKVEELDFTGLDSVLHLAALVHQMKGAPEEQYFKINRDLAYEVARKAKAQGVKHFLFMSTAKVFGETTTNLPAWDASSDCNPLDPYGKSKFEAEKLIRSLEDDSFKVGVVRSPLVYGAGVKANMYSLVKLVDTFPVLPLGGIRNRRSMVYVGNLVALLKHVIEKQASGVFIAGDEKPLSTTDLSVLIAQSLNKKVAFLAIPGFIVKLAGKVKPSIVDRLFGSLELDNSTTNRTLQFRPPFSSREGVQAMVDWYRSSK